MAAVKLWLEMEIGITGGEEVRPRLFYTVLPLAVQCVTLPV
jgi:hypothetical protein